MVKMNNLGALMHQDKTIVFEKKGTSDKIRQTLIGIGSPFFISILFFGNRERNLVLFILTIAWSKPQLEIQRFAGHNIVMLDI